MPAAPSAAEMEEHTLTGHTVYKAWCPHCVAGRGRDAPHSTLEPQGLPIIYADYNFLTEDGQLTRDAKSIAVGKKTLTCLVCVDRDSGATMAHVVGDTWKL